MKSKAIRRLSLSNHLSLLWDVDSIQKLSVVLVSDVAWLGNLGAGEWEVLDINTFEDNLILEFSTHLAWAAGKHINLVNLLSSQEVLDFKGFTVFGDNDVNGEVSMYESHLVSVALYINL
jgi:hypothetical protein